MISLEGTADVSYSWAQGPAPLRFTLSRGATVCVLLSWSGAMIYSRERWHRDSSQKLLHHGECCAFSFMIIIWHIKPSMSRNQGVGWHLDSQKLHIGNGSAGSHDYLGTWSGDRTCCPGNPHFPEINRHRSPSPLKWLERIINYITVCTLLSKESVWTCHSDRSMACSTSYITFWWLSRGR